MRSRSQPEPGRAALRRERGSALVVALLIMVIMTLLGLAFTLVGETEAKIARNQRDASQASYAAEGGVRMVRKWFEAPSGTLAYMVPTVSQMNRTLRYVDPDNDGILDDGDMSGTIGDHPCTAGNTTDCDDNCPHDFNPSQRDGDADGSGAGTQTRS